MTFTQRDIHELMGLTNEQTTLFEESKKPRVFLEDLETLNLLLQRLKTYGNTARDSEEIVFRKRKLLYEELSKHDCGEAIIHFIESDVWQTVRNQRGEFEFRGVERLSLPTEKEITIFSASVEDWEYDALGYETIFFSIPPVKNAGEVYQDATRSTSRQAMSKQSTIDFLAEETKDVDVHITYKSMIEAFENASEEVYVNNSAGYDGLKGKTIALSGENRQNPIELALWMKLFGFTPEKDWDDFRMTNLKDKYFEYPFYASPDSNVNRIMCMFIQEDLIQRTGRARPIREESALVKLYARTPTILADRIKNLSGDILIVDHDKERSN